jgi:hypothetical protein
LGLGFLSVSAGPDKLTRAAGSDQAALHSALGILAGEKSAAEGYASELLTVAKPGTAQYLRGFEYYHDAKPRFDELIEELRVDLIAGQNPESAKFLATLREAAERRVEFTSFVKREVGDKFKGARAGLPDVVDPVPELVKAFRTATFSIWKAYRDDAKEQRDLLLNELDRMKWRTFL